MAGSLVGQTEQQQGPEREDFSPSSAGTWRKEGSRREAEIACASSMSLGAGKWGGTAALSEFYYGRVGASRCPPSRAWGLPPG